MVANSNSYRRMANKLFVFQVIMLGRIVFNYESLFETCMDEYSSPYF